MSRPHDQAFQDWKNRANAVNILQEALRHGATMKRVGGEWKGPCPVCGGRDRFSVNDKRGKWFCRGADIGGADVISMVQHIAGLPFKASVASITGEPCPSGPARPLSEAEQAARNRQRLKMEDDRRARMEQEQAREADTKDFCAKIWNECVPISATLAERYLYLFDLPIPKGGWPSCLGFHPALQYPGKGKMPALVARVDDVAGELTGIWREFIGPDGRKAPVELQKLGLGPVAGGAVRIGGMGKHIGVGEGVRTALGAWALIDHRYPVWSCLSTSGLIGFEVPLGVERLTIYPDGDQPIKKQDGEFVPAIPAGRKAALAMKERVSAEGVACNIAAEPPSELDYLNLWQNYSREVA